MSNSIIILQLKQKQIDHLTQMDFINNLNSNSNTNSSNQLHKLHQLESNQQQYSPMHTFSTTFNTNSVINNGLSQSLTLVSSATHDPQPTPNHLSAHLLKQSDVKSNKNVKVQEKSLASPLQTLGNLLYALHTLSSTGCTFKEKQICKQCRPSFCSIQNLIKQIDQLAKKCKQNIVSAIAWQKSMERSIQRLENQPKSIQNPFEIQGNDPIVLVYEVPVEMCIQQSILDQNQDNNLQALTQQNNRLKKQLEMLISEINQNENSYVLNKIYEVPVELIIQEQHQGRDSNGILPMSSKMASSQQDLPVEQDYEIRIKSQKAQCYPERQVKTDVVAKIDTQPKIFNYSFCSLPNLNRNNNEQLTEQQINEESPTTPAFENYDWVYINKIYEVPVEINIQNTELQQGRNNSVAWSQTQNHYMGEGNRYNKKQFVQLTFNPRIFEFSSKQMIFGSCSGQMLQTRKRRRMPYIDHIKQDDKEFENQGQQGNGKQQNNISAVAHQMQMLLLSGEPALPTEQTEKKVKITDENYEITYKAPKADFQHYQSNGMEKSLKFTNDVGVQSIYLTDSKFLVPSTKVALTPQQSKEVKKSAFSQEIKPNKQNQQENNDAQNSNSLQRSLINGISVIRKKIQHSQTQSNSQIQDYLQVYQAHQHAHNEGESYQSKNTGFIDEMNNCNHCGVSVKDKKKLKGANRSLGSNFKNQQQYFVPDIYDAIEQRYSEQSKSKRTTLKMFGANVGNPSQISHQAEAQDFMTMKRKPKMERQGYFKIRRIGDKVQTQNERQRQLELGNNLLQQKSLIMDMNKDEQIEKKKAKQRLSEHPYLNFYEASEMEQVSQIHQKRQGTPQKKQEKKEPKTEQKEKKRYSFEQTSILLNFNSISGAGNESRESVVCTQGIVEAALKDGQTKNGIVNLKNQNNQVYIIDDGETSSEGSRANRQMKISEMRNSHSKSFKKQKNQGTPSHCSKPKQEIVDMSQFYQLQEKLQQIEQQKSSLMQKLQQAQLRIQQVKRESMCYEQRMCAMDNYYKQKLSNLLIQFNEYEKKLGQFESQLTQKTVSINQLAADVQDKNRMIAQYSTLITQQQQEIKHLSMQKKSMYQNFECTSKKSIKQSHDKQQVLLQLKQQITHLKHEMQIQGRVLQEQIVDRQRKVQQYLKQIQTSHNTIEQLKQDYNEIMNSLETACQEKQMYLMQLSNAEFKEEKSRQQMEAWAKVETIYQGQFNKCKEAYTKQLEVKSRKILELQIQNSQYHKQLKKVQQMIDETELNLRQKQAKITLLEKEARERNKVEVSVEVEEQLDYLRRQLVASAQEVDEKQSLIKKLYESIRQAEHRILQFQEEIQNIEKQSKKYNSPVSKSSNSNKHAHTSDNVNIQAIKPLNLHLDLSSLQHNQMNLLPITLPTSKSIFDRTIAAPVSSNSLAAQNKLNQELKISKQRCELLQITIREYDDNLIKLQKLIYQYQAIMMNNQQIIRDLQEQVGEYMQDAVEKERQNDALYEDIENYEIELNQTLKQKISVEIENKRLKKMIAASQKRISAIGTRLIHAAKDKLKNKQQQIANSQNSTLKMREIRAQ